ncbi:MAG: hypothetical protein L0G99_00320 [Propionibacteriales bacterium]|nr:hypothetical protein [Propionibacteriales bacterium]
MTSEPGDPTSRSSHHDQPTERINELERLLTLRDDAVRTSEELGSVRDRAAALERRSAEAEAAGHSAEEKLAALHRVSVARLYSAVRGTRAEDVDRQEGLVLRLRAQLEGIHADLEDCQATRDRLEQRLARLAGVDEELAAAMFEVEHALIRAGNPVRKSLAGLADRRADAAAELDGTLADQQRLITLAEAMDEVVETFGRYVAEGRRVPPGLVSETSSEGRDMDEAVRTLRSIGAAVRKVARRRGITCRLPPVPRALLALQHDAGADRGREDWYRFAQDQPAPIRAAARAFDERIDTARALLTDLDQLRLRWLRTGARQLSDRAAI